MNVRLVRMLVVARALEIVGITDIKGEFRQVSDVEAEILEEQDIHGELRKLFFKKSLADHEQKIFGL